AGAGPAARHRPDRSCGAPRRSKILRRLVGWGRPRPSLEYRATRKEALMIVQSYLFFDGRCEEAVEFYRRALGAEVTMLMRYKDCPDTPPPGTFPPGSANKVMHASLRIGETEVMASDGHCLGK